MMKLEQLLARQRVPQNRCRVGRPCDEPSCVVVDCQRVDCTLVSIKGSHTLPRKEKRKKEKKRKKKKCEKEPNSSQECKYGRSRPSPASPSSMRAALRAHRASRARLHLALSFLFHDELTSPLCVYHMAADESFDAVYRQSPSRLYTACVTGREPIVS